VSPHSASVENAVGLASFPFNDFFGAAQDRRDIAGTDSPHEGSCFNALPRVVGFIRACSEVSYSTAIMIRRSQILLSVMVVASSRQYPALSRSVAEARELKGTRYMNSTLWIFDDDAFLKFCRTFH
jgi:hypothetical protein